MQFDCFIMTRKAFSFPVLLIHPDCLGLAYPLMMFAFSYVSWNLSLMKPKSHETWPSQPQSLMGKNTKSKSKTAATVSFFFYRNLHSPTLSCCRRKCLSVPVMPVTGWQEVNTNEWSFRLSWIVHLVGGCRTKPVSSPTHWDNQHYMPSKK